MAKLPGQTVADDSLLIYSSLLPFSSATRMRTVLPLKSTFSYYSTLYINYKYMCPLCVYIVHVHMSKQNCQENHQHGTVSFIPIIVPVRHDDVFHSLIC